MLPVRHVISVSRDCTKIGLLKRRHFEVNFQAVKSAVRVTHRETIGEYQVIILHFPNS